MAICPFAVQQIIPESYTQGSISPTTLIYHRAVSSAESLQSYWNTPGVELESHFYIGQTGTLYQFMDTNVRADANVDANGFAVSVETWDGGNTPDDMPWNPAQLATAKRLAAWVCDTHGVRRGAAQTWNGGGIGGHNWFPYPWAGGPRGCPGTERNRQLREEIIPYVAAGGGWRTTPLEDDMSAEAEQRIADLHQAAVDTFKLSGVSFGRAIAEIRAATADMRAAMAANYVSNKEPIGKTTADVEAKLDALTTELDARLSALEGHIAGLSTGTGLSVSELAKALADEQDRRTRDSDPTTGPTT